MHSEQRLDVGTRGATIQPGADSEEKEGPPVPRVRQEMQPGREERRKLPDLPFQRKYTGGEDYYVRECFEEYYPHVEKFVLTEEDCSTVSGTPDIGTSVFYAYFFEEFWKAHRDEWIIVAISYMKNGLARNVAAFEDGVETTRKTIWDPRELSKFFRKIHRRLVKMATDENGELKEANTRSKKILVLCDGTPAIARQNMVVFTSPNDEWFRQVRKDDNFLFMPLWTPEELQKAALVLDLGLDDAQIAKRVEIFGGTARYGLCCDETKLVRAKNDLLEAIAAITDGNELRNLLLGKTAERTRHRLLHYQPLPSDTGYWETKLASAFVESRLERPLLMLCPEARERLQKSLANLTTAISLCDWFFNVDSGERLRKGCVLLSTRTNGQRRVS